MSRPSVPRVPLLRDLVQYTLKGRQARQSKNGSFESPIFLDSRPQPPAYLTHLHFRGERLDDINTNARLPRSVQALYLRPLRRKAEYGLPVCDLQLRSYSVRNLEFFADFAIRAAYYLNLPVSGPVPLPKIVERWTFPRSNFVHKKSQENFERITLRRLVQIKDGNSQAVQAWLAFVRKHAFYGVGMKANFWEHESIGMQQTKFSFGDCRMLTDRFEIQKLHKVWTRLSLRLKRAWAPICLDLAVVEIR